MIDPINIKAVTISDLWFQAVYKMMTKGKKFIIDEGSYAGQVRIEFDYFTGVITHPQTDIIPIVPPHLGIPSPVDPEYVYGGSEYERSYVEYIMEDTKNPNETYTYGERLRHYKVSNAILGLLENKQFHHVKEDLTGIVESLFIDQIDTVIKTYKEKGHRNNQCILQVGAPDDIILTDPPCLRHIDTRIQDNQLIFYPYFRSWDLWSGLPANLAGIQCLKEYMAAEIGVEDGPMIVASKGLHIYMYAEKIAKVRCMLP